MIAEMSMWTSMMTCKAMPSVYTELNPDTMSVLVANIASWADLGAFLTFDKDTSPAPGQSFVGIFEAGWIEMHWYPGVQEALVTLTRYHTDALCEDEVGPMLAEALEADVQCLDRRRYLHRPQAASHYPGFEEFIVRDTPLGVRTPSRYCRGSGREMSFTAEIAAWNYFFASQEYCLPHPGGIVLLHPCTWGKPYDQSCNGARLKRAIPADIPVNRCIVSNVGVVPAEYQANEAFVSYDYNVLLDGAEQEKREGGAFTVSSIIGCRVERFLRSHVANIGGIIFLGHGVNLGLAVRIKELCTELRIKGAIVPHPQHYRDLVEAAAGDSDPDAALFLPESLEVLTDRCRVLWGMIT